MKLKEVLKKLEYNILNGSIEVDIENIQYDSRNIKKNDIFFAIQGYSTDGHKFIQSAIEKGAKVIVFDKEFKNQGIYKDITFIKVKNSRKALAVASSNYYGNPKEKLKLIGITGTNGKTTSTFMIKSILEEADFNVGLMGTISNYIGGKKIHAERTTPESLEIHKLFKDMVEDGVDYCVMEVSSHSLYLDRVYGIEFNEGIFTNLTQDHLDFHKTFENYYNSKLILFKNSINSVINLDDNYGQKILKDSDGKTFTYSIKKHSDLKAENVELHSRGVEFTVDFKGDKEKINIHIPGEYNVSNALGSILACVNEGISLEIIKRGLEKLPGVPGRCEIVTRGYNLGYDVIVDYAHTPDGLDNVLRTARDFTKGKLISVYGCGGDRDRAKRPIMGKIGTELSDLAILTSDNPRTEEPFSIIDDIVKGITKDNYIVVESRREAIKKAMTIAKKDDVIVVAGKGHEDYQILKDKTIHFDEREVIKEIIEELY
ncbi:UDP-N-acetylmuramoyl-L-alanyl-D-glutamate--2,6-diaminopimelate ligase [Clostridium tetani]|uniref:UDP-N-acetylmuramoyl-L-alanyl-D-glutamate--2,6-diaminopimelate ligase n=1 Tax=Clostridium tetani TaxID=1513 RepID=A0ABY0ELP3_CLOTA|nr:UDP-N-acetylmuramoyl-L-alanyl-D-glutamate--2,6-diaminopimelate ligase [Clostridium tetani]CDI49765.1 UDP-N-acetylmuramoylalanyl-D-glutamate--2,6-diaminopimelate ligase [Clostridium tetani 12124569]KHO39018.1 UDP-N-acetylmuramoylalanyl-D-glutamate--2,6-diaminopimelate ligase [Clostridium tetani]RXI37974.1 UDP-N-acetylmuramoyl-L-alanyl-D-glutamate--2,6-diaminopimelate ligase [Clostridium tetani]RXI52470.1 UDP-N-acetylmuramoyl-L-alanyl-D-glutamate--2,6-diaminopimelate ligase [Clostridium tetani